MPADTWRTVQVAGQVGIPTTGVAAVEVNFTALNDASDGYLKADKDEATPNSSISYMFWSAGQPQSNTGVVAVASDGKIQVKATSSTNLLIDVQGYYTSGNPSAGGFVPTPESRLVDTRNGTGLPDASLTSGSTTTIQIGGLAGVPSDASAVMLNFLVTNQTGSGNFVAYPADATSVPWQYLHFDGDVPDATSQAVALSAATQTAGAIKLNLTMTGGGSVDMVVDVLGYFTANGSGGAFTPAAARAYDSRATGNASLAAGATRTIQVAGVSGIPSSGIAAVAANIEIFNNSGVDGGWTHVWPDDQIEPNPSMAVQYGAGDSASNLMTVALGADGGIQIHNMGSGSIDFAVDIEGWYSPSTLISGVASYGGTALAGAPVSLVAWPNSDVLSALADGADVPTETVASAVTDSNGNYQLAVDPSTLGSDYVDGSGIANFDVIVNHGNDSVDYSLSGAATPDSDGGSTALATPSTPDTVNFTFNNDADHTVTVTDTAAQQGASGTEAGLSSDGNAYDATSTGQAGSAQTIASSYVTAQDAAMSANSTDPDGAAEQGTEGDCSNWQATKTWYNDKSEFYLDAWTVDTAPETVDEEVGTRHTLGIGANVGSGKWTAHGTATLSKNTDGFAKFTYNKNTEIGNTVRYRKFTRACENSKDPSKNIYHHRVRPIQVTFLQSFTRNIGLMYFSHCHTWSSGTMGRRKGEAAQFDAGVDLSFVSLSAQAGFDSKTSVTFHIKSATAMCGSTAGGWDNSPEVGARSPQQPGT